MTAVSMQDVIKVEDQYYILISSSRTARKTAVLKHGDTFAVFDAFGDVQPIGIGEPAPKRLDVGVAAPPPAVEIDRVESGAQSEPAVAAEGAEDSDRGEGASHAAGRKRRRRGGRGRKKSSTAAPVVSLPTNES